MSPAASRAAVLALLNKRAAGATVCPSEVARKLAEANGTDNWRPEMSKVHAAVDELVREGAVRLSWKGRAMPLRDGPYRIALAGDA